MVVFGGLGMGCSCHAFGMPVMLERLSHMDGATPAGGVFEWYKTLHSFCNMKPYSNEVRGKCLYS